jgi:hypothetical protein
MGDDLRAKLVRNVNDVALDTATRAPCTTAAAAPP